MRIYVLALSVLFLGCASEDTDVEDATVVPSVAADAPAPTTEVATPETPRPPTCDPFGHWFVSVHFGAGSCENLVKEHDAEDLNVYRSGEIVDLRYGFGAKWTGVIDTTTCTLTAVNGNAYRTFACNQDNPDEGDCNYAGVEYIKWSVAPTGDITGTGRLSFIRTHADGSEPTVCWQDFRAGGFKYPLLFKTEETP